MKALSRGGAVAALVVLVLTAGCGGDEPRTSASAPPSSDQPSASPSASGPVAVKLGTTARSPSGIAFTVAAPAPYKLKPSTTDGNGGGAAPPKGTLLTFKITVKNGSAGPYDLAVQTASLMSGGEVAGQFYDSAYGIDVAPREQLAPGGTRTFTFGFGVQDPLDLTLTLPVTGRAGEAVVFTA